MSINRAAIAAQLLQQLQQALNTTAVNTKLADVLQVTPTQLTPLAIYLLQPPTSSSDANMPATVTLHISDEQVADSSAANNVPAGFTPGFGRKLQMSVVTQFKPTAANAALQLLDIIAEQVELVFDDDENAKPWLQTQLRHTDFAFEATDTASVKGQMTQYFSVSYHLQREEVCTAVRPKEVYLSKHGGPYELVASLPAD